MVVNVKDFPQTDEIRIVSGWHANENGDIVRD